jgi:kynureninase
MEFAAHTAKTDKIIVFDGATGGANVSRSLADHLKAVASRWNERVDRELMPKWLSQRNLDPALLSRVD